jgi:hypothetical protein
MARFNDTAHNTTEPGVTDFDGTQKQDNDLYDIVGKIIDTGVRIIGIVPFTIGKILENFIGHNRPGIKILAALMLGGGVILSADSFFQSFGGKPLFPFWEKEWIGAGWLIVWTKVNFWAAVIVSLGVQWIESQAIRGKEVNEARRDYDSIKHHTVPDKNPKAIDLVEARRRDYKRVGMGERSILGVFILLVFVMDFAATFIVGRNPWGLPPTEFLGVLIYNFCTMIAGETGFALWERANRKH